MIQKKKETLQQRAMNIPDDPCLGYACKTEHDEDDYTTIPEIFY